MDEKIKECNSNMSEYGPSGRRQVMTSGCTANVVLITPAEIYCANAGDSRAVLRQHSKGIALSSDHKPNDPIESARIRGAGHDVEMDRVDGSLALSRAIGDLDFKDCKDKSAKEQAVTVFPDVTSRARSPDDKFIIVACDGIWDCLTN